MMSSSLLKDPRSWNVKSSSFTLRSLQAKLSSEKRGILSELAQKNEKQKNYKKETK